MFQDLEGLVKKVTTGEIDQQSVSVAAQQEVNTTPHEELAKHVETAADNAQQNGQPEIAQQLIQIFQQSGSDPQKLKQDVVSLISSNPQILQHFEPEFAKRILGSL